MDAPLKDINFPMHTHHELKHDLRKKCRLVAGGNRLDASGQDTSSSMVKNVSVKLLLLIDASNNLKAEGGNIENTCLNEKFGEKMWTIAGPEFSDKSGMKVLTQKASCGLKKSARKFWELLADVLREIGLTPTKNDNNA